MKCILYKRNHLANYKDYIVENLQKLKYSPLREKQSSAAQMENSDIKKLTAYQTISPEISYAQLAK